MSEEVTKTESKSKSITNILRSIIGAFNCFNHIGIGEKELDKILNKLEEKFESKLNELEEKFESKLDDTADRIDPERWAQIILSKILDTQNLFEKTSDKLKATFSNNIKNIISEINNNFVALSEEINENTDAIEQLENKNLEALILLNKIKEAAKDNQKETISEILKNREISIRTEEAVENLKKDVKSLTEKVENAKNDIVVQHDQLKDQLKIYFENYFKESNLGNLKDISREGANAADTLMLAYESKDKEQDITEWLINFNNDISKVEEIATDSNARIKNIETLIRNQHEHKLIHGVDCPQCKSEHSRIYKCEVCGFNKSDEKSDPSFFTEGKRSKNDNCSFLVRDVGIGGGQLLIVYSDSEETTDAHFVSTTIVNTIKCDTNNITRILFRNTIKKIWFKDGNDKFVSIFSFFPNLHYVSFEKPQTGDTQYELGENLFAEYLFAEYLFAESCGRNANGIRFFGINYIKTFGAGCFHFSCGDNITKQNFIKNNNLQDRDREGDLYEAF